jgi:hypothetical protein
MRRWMLIGLLPILAVAGCAFVLWPCSVRLTFENCARIKEGMSQAEVESILGGRQGDYRTRPGLLFDVHGSACFPRGDFEPYDQSRGQGDDSDIAAHIKTDFTYAFWANDTGAVSVFFDASKKVLASNFHARSPDNEQNVLKNLRWRAERQWDRWFPNERPDL